HPFGVRSCQRPDAADLRVRGGGDRWHGIAVGNAARRHRPGRGADRRRADPSAVCSHGGPSSLPRGPDRPLRRRPPGAEDGMKVQRWTRTSRLFTGGTGVVAILLACVPLVFESDVVQKLTTLLILVLLAAMWNALAGYGGLLSVGQQAFIGIGAYGTVFFADHGVTPYLAMVLATLLAGAISLPISLFALRLRAAQFAIGMWV